MDRRGRSYTQQERDEQIRYQKNKRTQKVVEDLDEHLDGRNSAKSRRTEANKMSYLYMKKSTNHDNIRLALALKESQRHQGNYYLQNSKISEHERRKREDIIRAGNGIIKTFNNKVDDIRRQRSKFDDDSRKTLEGQEKHICELTRNVNKQTFYLNDRGILKPINQANVYLCDKCPKGPKQFLSLESLKEHDNYIHKRITCEKCGQFYTSQSSFDEHMEMHRRRKCSLCGESLENEEMLIKHKTLNHVMGNKMITCEIEGCEKDFKGEESYQEHKKLHGMIECTQCHSFVPKEEWENHRMKVHGFIQKHCKKCKESFTKMSSYEKHMRCKFSFLKCTTCPKEFVDKPTLEEHQNVHMLESKLPQHINEDNKLFKCDKCPEEFILKKSYDHHMNSHQKNIFSVLKCESCPKQSFDTMIALNQHIIQKHKNYGKDEDGEFKCDVCGSKFTYLMRLLQHKENGHTGEGKFKCKDCSHNYSSNYALNLHLNHCKKDNFDGKFERESDRAKARRTCRYCDQEFPSDRHRQKHVSKKHKIEHMEFIKEHKTE